MAKNEQSREANQPIWFDGKSINEALFCDDFLGRHKIIYTNGAFFTPDGRVTDELPLRGEIFEELKCCAVSNIPRKISNIVELMKLAALVEDFPPEADRIHLANGTLFLDGSFTEGKPDIVRCRLPVAYNPDAPTPTRWLAFLDGLLYPEDIPTLQEYIGYCLIPSNKGQRMMVIKGNGGEGKSQIGAVLSALFGSNMKDGSIGKISENRFARADLEHILLWAFAGLQQLVANNFKFTESQRTRENREAVKRDNNNVFDFLESEGYIRLKADASISSKDCYDIYRMWCEENSLTALKRRSFSDALMAACGKYNLEHCNTITNSAGRRVWGFMGIEAVARPHINEFTDASQCTYVPEDWRD